MKLWVLSNEIQYRSILTHSTNAVDDLIEFDVNVDMISVKDPCGSFDEKSAELQLAYRTISITNLVNAFKVIGDNKTEGIGRCCTRKVSEEVVENQIFSMSSHRTYTALH